MINNFLEIQIKKNFHFEPTFQQLLAIEKIAKFFSSTQKDELFLLKGYAGTGKTSLIAALVKALDQLKQKVILLAPTGRAAKVFASYANHSAFTIHKSIYRQTSYLQDNFNVLENLRTNTLFIVDEASMISNSAYGNSTFGSGRLLTDLMQYVYSGKNCRLMLIGDEAQLPPVGEDVSVALDADYLTGFGVTVSEVALTDVVRQDKESGILWNATELRNRISDDFCDTLPKVKVSTFTDIKPINGAELLEEIDSSYGRYGIGESVVLCRSNKRANIYNNGIRNSILFREEELSSGDHLMITKNNYFWATDKSYPIDFIANGDIAIVQRVRNTVELYGFRFAQVVLSFPDYDDLEIEVKILLDTLHSDAASLSREQHEKLFREIEADYADVTNKRDRYQKIKVDSYFNALQVKFAYAITCHKAQGGQWQNVFLDQGYMKDEYLTPDYFRWLYTAFTRTVGCLYLVNYPSEQTI